MTGRKYLLFIILLVFVLALNEINVVSNIRDYDYWLREIIIENSQGGMLILTSYAFVNNTLYLGGFISSDLNNVKPVLFSLTTNNNDDRTLGELFLANGYIVTDLTSFNDHVYVLLRKRTRYGGSSILAQVNSNGIIIDAQIYKNIELTDMAVNNGKIYLIGFISGNHSKIILLETTCNLTIVRAKEIDFRTKLGSSLGLIVGENNIMIIYSIGEKYVVIINDDSIKAYSTPVRIYHALIYKNKPILLGFNGNDPAIALLNYTNDTISIYTLKNNIARFLVLNHICINDKLILFFNIPRTTKNIILYINNVTDDLIVSNTSYSVQINNNIYLYLLLPYNKRDNTFIIVGYSKNEILLYKFPIIDTVSIFTYNNEPVLIIHNVNVSVIPKYLLPMNKLYYTVNKPYIKISSINITSAKISLKINNKALTLNNLNPTKTSTETHITKTTSVITKNTNKTISIVHENTTSSDLSINEYIKIFILIIFIIILITSIIHRRKQTTSQ